MSTCDWCGKELGRTCYHNTGLEGGQFCSSTCAIEYNQAWYPEGGSFSIGDGWLTPEGEAEDALKRLREEEAAEQRAAAAEALRQSETLKLVNSTNSKISYCIVYWKGSQQVKSGWYTIEAGSAKERRVSGISWDAGGCFGVYAEGGGLKWGDGSYGSFEVTNKVFTEASNATFGDGYTAKFTQVRGSTFTFRQSDAVPIADGAPVSSGGKSQPAAAALEAGNRGLQAMEAGNNEQAIAEYYEAIRLDPNNANYYISRCMAYIQTGDFVRAIADGTKAIGLAPEAFNYAMRGKAYFSNEDYDKAIADMETAVNLEPSNSDYTEALSAMQAEKENADFFNEFADDDGDEQAAEQANQRGNEAYNAQNYDKAIAEYNKAVELVPYNPIYFANRANAYYNKCDYDKAIADYKTAVALNMSNADYKQWLANAEAAKAAQANALKFVNKTGSKIWYCVAYWHISGVVKKKKGWWDVEAGAAKTLQIDDISLDLDGCFGVYAYTEDGKLKWGDGSYGSYEVPNAAFYDNDSSKYTGGYIAKFTKVNGSSFTFQESNATQGGSAPKSNEDWLKELVREEDPLSAELAYQCGLEAYNAQDYDKAIAEFTEAVKLDPNDAAYKHNLAVALSDKAVALRNAGKYDEALLVHNKIFEFTTDAAAYSGRGWTYFLKGDYQKALADMDEALRLEPGNKSREDRRAQILEKLAAQGGSKTPKSNADWLNELVGEEDPPPEDEGAAQPAAGAKFCSQCGAKLAADAKFCSQCGAKAG